MQDGTQTSEIEFALTQRATRVRYLVLVLVALASSSAYLTRYCITVSATTIRDEFQLTNEQMGAIFSAFFWGYLLFQVPGGWLGTRFGTRFALALLSALWSGFTLATAAVASFLPLCATRFAFGSAQAGLVPNSALVVKDWIPLRHRGMSSALIAASMSIGGAATMEITAQLIETYHWRTIFRGYSLVGIVWAVLYYWLARNRPYEHPWVNEAESRLIDDTDGRPEAGREKEWPAQSDGTVAHENAATPTTWHMVVSALSSITLWAVCTQAFFRAAGYGLFVTFFPTFLQDAYQISTKDAGTFAKWPLLGVVTGSLSGGMLVDFVLKRTGSKRLSRSGVASLSLGLCGLITLASAWTASVGQLVALMAFGALLSGFAGPAVWAVTIDVAGKRTAVIMGVMNMAGCISGVVIPPYLGRMIDTIQATDGDWNQVIYLHVFFYFAAAVCFLVVNPNRVVTEPRKHAVS